MKIAARNPADVVDDAAAEGDDHARPVRAALRASCSASALHFRQALARFAAGEETATSSTCALQAGAVQLPDVFGGDDENLAGTFRNELRDALKRAALDDRVVGSLRRLDAKAGHTFVVPWACCPDGTPSPSSFVFLFFAAPLRETGPSTIFWAAPAILVSALMIAWAAESAQYFIAQGLALAILAWMQTLPEFAVEAVLAWKQQVPSAAREPDRRLAAADRPRMARDLFHRGDVASAEAAGRRWA